MKCLCNILSIQNLDSLLLISVSLLVTDAIPKSTIEWIHTRHEAVGLKGMATYSAKALLSGRISEVKDLMKNALHDLKR